MLHKATLGAQTTRGLGCATRRAEVHDMLAGCVRHHWLLSLDMMLRSANHMLQLLGDDSLQRCRLAGAMAGQPAVVGMCLWRLHAVWVLTLLIHGDKASQLFHWNFACASHTRKPHAPRTRSVIA